MQNILIKHYSECIKADKKRNKRPNFYKEAKSQILILQVLVELMPRTFKVQVEYSNIRTKANNKNFNKMLQH